MSQPKALLDALNDKETGTILEARLRVICDHLTKIGKFKDYYGKDVSYLDTVFYGVGGIPFSRINDFLSHKKEKK